MCHRLPRLHRGERRRHRRVDVAHHHHQIRTHRLQDRLEPRHDLGDLCHRAYRLHLQVHVGPRNLEVREERVRHLRVVVLARVNQSGRYVRILAQLGQDGSDLDEVRARPDDRQDLHATPPTALTRPTPASTSRTGANRNSRSSRRSFASVLPRVDRSVGPRRIGPTAQPRLVDIDLPRMEIHDCRLLLPPVDVTHRPAGQADTEAAGSSRLRPPETAIGLARPSTAETRRGPRSRSGTETVARRESRTDRERSERCSSRTGIRPRRERRGSTGSPAPPKTSAPDTRSRRRPPRPRSSPSLGPDRRRTPRASSRVIIWWPYP